MMTDRTPTYHPNAEDPFAGMVRRGMRVAKRLAVSFAAAFVAAIGLSVVAADNAFVQLLIIAVATFVFWLPLFFLIAGVERLFTRKPAQPGHAEAVSVATERKEDRVWRRLAVAAPRDAERIGVLQRSIERSRLALGKADLDPDAHDVCLLIDRRLPELIERELDDLPPDDRGRREQINELVDLIEQFARDCSRRNGGDSAADRHGAEVLRRRFEAHLSKF